jgi:hypothetical protein
MGAKPMFNNKRYPEKRGLDGGIPITEATVAFE